MSLNIFGFKHRSEPPFKQPTCPYILGITFIKPFKIYFKVSNWRFVGWIPAHGFIYTSLKISTKIVLPLSRNKFRIPSAKTDFKRVRFTHQFVCPGSVDCTQKKSCTSFGTEEVQLFIVRRPTDKKTLMKCKYRQEKLSLWKKFGGIR